MGGAQNRYRKNRRIHATHLTTAQQICERQGTAASASADPYPHVNWPLRSVKALNYGKYLSLKSAVVFGGVNMNPQIAMLRHGVDISVATPGRLSDLVNQNHVNLSQVEIFVLDEADRMLDMGFIHDVRKIIKLLPQKRQNLLLFQQPTPTRSKNSPRACYVSR